MGSPKRGHRDCDALASLLDGSPCLWQQVVPNVGMLNAYAVRGALVMFMDFVDDGGWDVWLPVSTNSVAETVGALHRRLGLETEHEADARRQRGADENQPCRVNQIYNEWDAGFISGAEYEGDLP